MFIHYLFSNPLYMLLVVLPMGLVAITFHEVAHGYVAYRLGDPTAHNAGRLTLNPIAHFDLFGTLAILLLGFGWAKPVPVNPRYFKDPGKGMMITALAGPASNLIMATAFLILFRLAVLLPVPVAIPLVKLFGFGAGINIILMVFNLIPIPPLDGSRVLAYILPPNLSYRFQELERYGLFLVIGLLFILPRLGFNFTGFLFGWAFYLVALVSGVPLWNYI